MGDASDSGERQKIGDRTSITLKTAVSVMVVCVIPLTWFIASLSFGLHDTNAKIDELNRIMDIRRKARDDQYETVSRKLDDHEVRLRAGHL